MEKLDVAYVRVSTKKVSQQDSPENQESFIRDVAAREGMKIGDVYLDRDTATSIVYRADVQRLVENAKLGKIRSVWFASLSRFSRDVIDALSLKRILVNGLKIRVVSIEDGYDSKEKDDELLFGIKSVVNQNSSKDTSTASRRGIRESVLEKLNFIGNIPPFGYVKVRIGKRKTLDYNPDQYKATSLLWELAIDGLGDKSIVYYLNGENPEGVMYPSYTGQLWDINSVASVLNNPNYTGHVVSGRYTTEVSYDDLDNLMDRKKKLVKQPPEKWEWSKEPAHPAYVTRAQFDEVQDRRLVRGGKVKGGRRTFVNVFAKKIFCTACGSAMVTMTSKSRDGGKDYRYLMCSRRRRVGEKGCPNGKWIPYFDARDEIMEEILARIAKGINRFERTGTNDVEFTLPTTDYEKEKRKLERRIETHRKLLFEVRRQHMLEEINKDQYDFEKAQYEKEITDCESKLSSIVADEQRALDKVKLVKESKKVLSGLTSMASYNDDVAKTRALLDKVLRRIEVSPNGDIQVQTYV